LVSVAQASTILLTDNYSAGGVGADFNNSNSTTQTGTLAAVAYDIRLPSAPDDDDTWRIQHSNSGQLLSLPSSAAGLAHNFQSDANAANSPLQISFNIDVGNWNNSTNPLTWAQFNIGSATNLAPLDANVGFATLFRLNGYTSQISAGGDITVGSGQTWTANSLVIIKLSDTVGTGSAFNGNGTRVAMTIDGDTKTYDVPQMSAAYLTFGGYYYELDGGIAKVDNLSVALVPEPSTYGLLSIAGISLLFARRRKMTA
jgi:hypothetical protein